ncbi:MAG TPA: PEP-CTERM sorting domain-containing protein, partial [Pyrinomonadaceae bacterium]
FPAGLAGGQNPVTFTATFSSNNPGVSGSFRWGAALYTQMSTDLNALGVLPTEMGDRHVGTPVNFEHFVIGGARGGGGSNFTGSWSAAGHFTPCTMTPTPTPTPTPLTTPLTTVPEPTTIVLFGSGLAAFGGAAFRRFFEKKASEGSDEDTDE